MRGGCWRRLSGLEETRGLPQVVGESVFGTTAYAWSRGRSPAYQESELVVAASNGLVAQVHSKAGC